MHSIDFGRYTRRTSPDLDRKRMIPIVIEEDLSSVMLRQRIEQLGLTMGAFERMRVEVQEVSVADEHRLRTTGRGRRFMAHLSLLIAPLKASRKATDQTLAGLFQYCFESDSNNFCDIRIKNLSPELLNYFYILLEKLIENKTTEEELHAHAPYVQASRKVTATEAEVIRDPIELTAAALRLPLIQIISAVLESCSYPDVKNLFLRGYTLLANQDQKHWLFGPLEIAIIVGLDQLKMTPIEFSASMNKIAMWLPKNQIAVFHRALTLIKKYLTHGFPPECRLSSVDKLFIRNITRKAIGTFVARISYDPVLYEMHRFFSSVYAIDEAHIFGLDYSKGSLQGNHQYSAVPIVELDTPIFCGQLMNHTPIWRVKDTDGKVLFCWNFFSFEGVINTQPDAGYVSKTKLSSSFVDMSREEILVAINHVLQNPVVKPVIKKGQKQYFGIYSTLDGRQVPILVWVDPKSGLVKSAYPVLWTKKYSSLNGPPSPTTPLMKAVDVGAASPRSVSPPLMEAEARKLIALSSPILVARRRGAKPPDLSLMHEEAFTSIHSAVQEEGFTVLDTTDSYSHLVVWEESLSKEEIRHHFDTSIRNTATEGTHSVISADAMESALNNILGITRFSYIDVSAIVIE